MLQINQRFMLLCGFFTRYNQVPQSQSDIRFSCTFEFMINDEP